MNHATLGRFRPSLLHFSALAWGLQFAFLSPSIALLLSSLYGAGTGAIGIALVVSNTAGFVASLVVPAVADRRRDYLGPMIVCGALTLVLAATLWATTSLLVAVAALTIVGAPAGVGSSLLFAHLRHSGAPRREIFSTRAIMSFSWVAGPPAATGLVAAVGARALLPAIAVIALANIGLTVAMRRRSGAREADAEVAADIVHETQPSGARSGALWLLGFMIVAFVALQATNNTTMSVMNLFVVQHLQLPVIWGGIALAVAALAEIPALILIGRLHERVSSRSLVLVACGVGLVFYLGMSIVDGPIPLTLLQLLNAAFFAVVSGVGLTLFQDLLPTRPGLASGMFANTRRIGSIVSGGLIALASTSWGYSAVFIGCAALVVIAFVVVLTARRGRIGAA